ncbi:phage gpG-like protein [Endobacter medicaginis]|uniref:Phage gpG-like protein n=1 Tax=Endobacter medicaginis TaxID=1181271 RepID=A0A839UYG6_9PROT|nr:hypothetical protein [Endobacter medicaginis]MBB3175398.1 phage gpG-like protein [Endobacter medicaginis]MCX5476740.1 hypothetical protein [Endobacter medicaginis]NVN29346.1 hypothetical protein [Endobacter medicaginis]
MKMSPGQFAAHLAGAAARSKALEHQLLERVGELVQQRAKSYLGHEQDGWPALAESTISEKQRHGYPTPSPLLRDGELRDSIRHAVDGHRVVIGSTSEISVYQELGTERIPPRPFLAKAAVESEPEIRRMAAELGKRIIISRE